MVPMLMLLLFVQMISDVAKQHFNLHARVSMQVAPSYFCSMPLASTRQTTMVIQCSNLHTDMVTIW